MADFVYQTDKNTTYLSKYYHKVIHSKPFIYACGAVGLYFFCAVRYLNGIYSFLSVIPYLTSALLWAVGAGMLLYFIVYTHLVKKIFSCKLFQWLGKISFETYAFHWPIMLCLEDGLFLAFYDSLGYDGAAVLAFVITLPVIYAVGYLAWYLLERNRNYDVRKLGEWWKNLQTKNTPASKPMDS